MARRGAGMVPSSVRVRDRGLLLRHTHHQQSHQVGTAWLRGLAFGMVCLMVCCSFPVLATPEPLADSVTRQMQANRQRYGIVGQAVSITHNGKQLYRGADGVANLESRQPATPALIFPAFSVSKLFVSTLIMQLVDAEQIDLDRPARRYLPALPERWKQITVRQLLDHTSGLPEYFNPEQMSGSAEANASFPGSAQAVFAALAAQPLVAAPGSKTRYTNTNYLVLAQLLQAHYRKPYPQIAAERIIAKLHLSQTSLGRVMLPARGVATAYLSENRALRVEPDVAWPEYALGHAALYTSIADLTTFLEAVRTGQLVSKATLRRLWQPQTLANGQRGWFAGGWEVGQSETYRYVGHDGGARVRVRILFDGADDGDSYSIVYLTNGSARGVWSRVLVDSVMAAIAPQRFRSEALSETLIAFALRSPDEKDIRLLAQTLRADSGIPGDQLERTINTAGYSILSNLGAGAAIPVFALNVRLFPASRNALDSLAEAYEASGDVARAKALRQTLRLSENTKD